MNQTDNLSVYNKNAENVPFVARTGLKAIKMEADGIQIMMPLEPNVNHIGIMYAGALWTLAESMGGAASLVYLMVEGTFPIVKAVNIKFVKPATTDIFCEYQMDAATASSIVDTCIKNGKADYNIDLELKDAKGNVVAVSEGLYQIRKGTGL